MRIEGDGRENPAPAQRLKPGTDSLSHLNIARGTRIRVLECGRRDIAGYEGVVIQSFPGSVVVKLDDDPALRHRIRMIGGFAIPQVPPKRHFRVTEVERI
jgi:hypothetical protein